MVKWSDEKHRRVFYSDECKVEMGLGRRKVKAKKGQDRTAEMFRTPKNSHPVSIFIWMMISYDGVEEVVWINNKVWIDGEDYRQLILKDHVVT